jgi:hypothetical protein
VVRFYSNPRDTGEGKSDFIAVNTVPVGQSITATATDPAGNTSEFTGEPRFVRAAP